MERPGSNASRGVFVPAALFSSYIILLFFRYMKKINFFHGETEDGRCQEHSLV